MLKSCLTAAAVLMLGGQLATAAAADDPLQLKFAVFTPEKEITYQTIMKPWAEKVMADTNGAVEIKMFPGGTLGRDGSKQLKMLKDGVADIAFIIPAYNPGLFPDNEITELPNLIHDATEGSVAFWRLYDKGMLRGYEDLEVFALVTTSPYLMHGTFEMDSVDDLEGHKIRAAGKLEQACLTALGAVPVGMPISKIPESLSRGVIDATPMHYAALHAFGVAGATDHHYENRLGALPFGFVMTKARFAELPPAVQKAMTENGGEVLSKAFGAAMDAENARLRKETLADPDQTVVEPSAEDVAAWDAKVKPCIDDWTAGHEKGTELLDAMQSELAAIRKE
ncbi:TRAP transporter substrate-binding protein [Marinibaculum pumilum]|uniref:TRAP transporter substrate-binding protein n=1 Tax=Marinibaculum pumilum TaxID=1766165 RepID=A0ABV7LAA2_9PROT